jgi:hypothetical protein
MVLPSLLSCGERVCSPHCERTDYQGLRLGLVHKSENEGNYALSHQTSELLNGTLTPLAPSLL